MMNDRVVAITAMICATVALGMVVLSLAWSATHGGDLLVLATGITTVVGSITGAVLKRFGGGSGGSTQ